jgi:hypothetical protein
VKTTVQPASWDKHFPVRGAGSTSPLSLVPCFAYFHHHLADHLSPPISIRGTHATPLPTYLGMYGSLAETPMDIHTCTWRIIDLSPGLHSNFIRFMQGCHPCLGGSLANVALLHLYPAHLDESRGIPLLRLCRDLYSQRSGCLLH